MKKIKGKARHIPIKNCMNCPYSDLEDLTGDGSQSYFVCLDQEAICGDFKNVVEHDVFIPPFCPLDYHP